MTFHIPRTWPVLVVDDSEDRISWFRHRLRNARFAKSSSEAIDLLSRHDFKVAFIDHDLHWLDAVFPERQLGNGKEICRYIVAHQFEGVVVVHSKSDQATVMARILPQAKVCRFGDFGIAECE